MRRGSYDPAVGFTSRAQMEDIAGLHGARSAGGAGTDALLLSRTEPRPLKNAGYGAADGGLVREQVYASIRQLDAGTLSVDAFEQELRALGVVLPPAARACLARHRAAGDVKFAAFVQVRGSPPS